MRITVRICLLSVFACAGCFKEASFDLRPGDVHAIDPPAATAPRAVSTRDWLADAQSQLGPLLPRSARPALLTDQLVQQDGIPTDVYKHFGVDPRRLRKLFGNFSGLLLTAQVCSTKDCIDSPAPDWPGFETVWIPIDEHLSLCGRMGLSRDNGRVRDADCIVLVTGFLGDNGGCRIRNAAEGLLKSGFHVVAVELRGHGQTARRFPDVNYNYGVCETADLLLVSEWLERQPHVRRTGLLGFCWGGNLALLTAWLDGRSPNDPGLSPLIECLHRPVSRQPHFSAGVLVFCPALQWEALMDELDTPHTRWDDPVLCGLQDAVYGRMARNKSVRASTRLRDLIDAEIARTTFADGQAYHDGMRMLRLMDYRGQPAGRKLMSARVPVLIVQSANDPLSAAQDVAEFIAMTPNPNLAAIILPGGGHTGFAPYCRAYYYSLMAAFFDPVSGATAVSERSRAARLVAAAGR